MEITKR